MEPAARQNSAHTHLAKDREKVRSPAFWRKFEAPFMLNSNFPLEGRIPTLLFSHSLQPREYELPAA